MTPQDVAALTAIAAIVKQIGTWPLISIAVLVIIGPWIAVFILNRGQEKRHAEVVEMYTANVRLVTAHEELQEQSQRREEVLIDLLRLNTEAQTGLITWLKQRTRCVELKGGPGGKHECGA